LLGAWQGDAQLVAPSPATIPHDDPPILAADARPLEVGAPAQFFECTDGFAPKRLRLPVPQRLVDVSPEVGRKPVLGHQVEEKVSEVLIVDAHGSHTFFEVDSVTVISLH
jgi:hypothetical protein